MSEDMKEGNIKVEEISNYAEFEERRRKIQIIRWIAVVVYMVIVIAASLLPLAMEVDEGTYGGLLVVLVAILTAGLIGVIAFPYFNKLKLPDVIGEGVTEGLTGENVDLSRSWQERVFMKALLYGVIAVIFILALVTFIDTSTEGMGISIGVLVFIIGIMVIFSSLEIVCSPTALSFHYGPIGKTIPLENIASIRSTSIHPLKDFMGWGIRVGSDGTIGYIAAGNVGVRVQLKDGKQYVVTLNDPQSLVEYVEAAQTVHRE